jgi:hypothetical protein
MAENRKLLALSFRADRIGAVVPFSSAVDSQISQSNASIVAAYTGFTVNYSTQLVTRSSGTEAQLYDWLALEKASLDSSGGCRERADSAQVRFPNSGTTIYDRVSGAFAYNLRIVGSRLLNRHSHDRDGIWKDANFCHSR